MNQTHIVATDKTAFLAGLWSSLGFSVWETWKEGNHLGALISDV